MSFHVPAGFVVAGMVTVEFGEVFSVDHSETIPGKPVQLNRNSLYGDKETVEVIGNCFQLNVFHPRTHKRMSIDEIKLYRCAYLAEYDIATAILENLLLSNKNPYVMGEIIDVNPLSEKPSTVLLRAGNIVQEKVEESR